MNKISFLFFVVSVGILISCSQGTYLGRINSYLNAYSVRSRSKYMAANYRGFFMEKKGGGKDKPTALKSFQNWDGPMHPDVKILCYTVSGHAWIVTFIEQNDFSKLIGYPGWKGTTAFTFNSRRLIEETVYVPDSSNLPYGSFLRPALDWLQKNRPTELYEVFQDNKLIQTEESANKWKMLLRAYKAAMKQSR